MGKRGSDRQVLFGAVLSYVVIAAQFVVALLFTPFALRSLGLSDYGLLTLAMSVVAYLSLLSLGLNSAYIRFFSRYRVVDDRAGIDALNGLFLVMFGISAVLVVLGGSILALKFHVLFPSAAAASSPGTVVWLVVLLSANVAVTLLSSVFVGYTAAHEKFVVQKCVQLAQTALAPALAVPLFLWGVGPVGLAASTLAVNFLTSCVLAAFAIIILRFRVAWRGWQPNLLRQMAGFSFFVFLNMIVDQLYWGADKVIIGATRGVEEVGVYGVGFQFVSIYMLLSVAVSGVFVPRVHELVSSGASAGRIVELWVRVGRVQLTVLGLFLSGFALFGREFIEIWAGPAFRDAYPIVLVIIIPLTVPLIQNLAIDILRALDLHAFRSWMLLLVAVGKVVLTVWSTSRFGGIGAAAASGLSLLVGNVAILNVYYQRRAGLRVGRFFRQLIPLALTVGVVWVVGGVAVSLAEPKSGLGMVVAGIVYAVVYLAASALFGWSREDRRQARVLLAK